MGYAALTRTKQKFGRSSSMAGLEAELCNILIILNILPVVAILISFYPKEHKNTPQGFLSYAKQSVV